MSLDNIKQLQTYLTDTLQRVADGEITPAGANAAANLAGKVLASVKMVMDYNKMQGTSPHLEFLDDMVESQPRMIEAPKKLQRVNKRTGELIG